MPYKNPDEERRYHRERARRRRKDPKHAEYMRAYRLKWYAKNRDRIVANYDPRRARDYRLRCVYGITLAQWESLFRAQGKRCALCRTKTPGTAKGWHTDHDHHSKRVRGILCKGCNTGLGQLGLNGKNALTKIARLKEYVR